MKITSISVWQLDLPLPKPYYLPAFGKGLGVEPDLAALGDPVAVYR